MTMGWRIGGLVGLICAPGEIDFAMQTQHDWHACATLRQIAGFGGVLMRKGDGALGARTTYKGSGKIHIAARRRRRTSGPSSHEMHKYNMRLLAKPQ